MTRLSLPSISRPFLGLALFPFNDDVMEESIGVVDFTTLT